MAFLLPENISSRSDIPDRLRQVAAALRDHTPEEVTVWLRQTDSEIPYLIVLDPTSGILVIDAPLLSPRGRRRFRRERVFDSFDMVRIPEEVAHKASDLKMRIDSTAIAQLPVRCALAVPNQDEVPIASLAPQDQALPILTRSDLTEDRLASRLRDVLGGGRTRPLREHEENWARAVVNPEIVLPRASTEKLPLFKDPEIAPEDVIRVMDRKQERVAEHLGDGYRVLRGVAGSGKTLVLAYRARHLHMHHPNWRILVLCFNRVLAEALKKIVEPDNEHLEVTNIDRLSYQLVKPSGGGKPDFDELALRAAEAAQQLDDSERYDAVLVDEAQDFDHRRLDLAYSMLKSDRLHAVADNRDNFLMAYDTAQNVYRKSGATWKPPSVDADGHIANAQERIRTARGRSTAFKINYRNTREILEFAMHFLAGTRDWHSAAVNLDDPAALITPEAARRTGTSPRLSVHSDLRGESEHIAARVAELRANDVADCDIVVLYGCMKLEQELRQTFKRRGLPYFHVQERYNRDKAVHTRDKVRVSTLTGIKGLEFNRVFVGGVNHIYLRDVSEDERFPVAKRQLYAALTRAMDELEITMSGNGEIGVALREAARLSRAS